MGEIDRPNAILVTTTPIPQGTRTAELRVLIRDVDGQVIKHLGWGDWFQQDSWTHTTIQWNGSELSTRKDSLVTNSGVVFTDSSGNMSDIPAREFFYGGTRNGTLPTFSGIVGHLGIWESILGDDELSVVFSGGLDMDLTTSSGSYVSQGNLRHYLKPGGDPSNIGKDFVTSGTLDLDKLRDITTDNIIIDSP